MEAKHTIEYIRIPMSTSSPVCLLHTPTDVRCCQPVWINVDHLGRHSCTFMDKAQLSRFCSQVSNASRGWGRLARPSRTPQRFLGRLDGPCGAVGRSTETLEHARTAISGLLQFRGRLAGSFQGSAARLRGRLGKPFGVFFRLHVQLERQYQAFEE